jgi:hypothetical protein
MGVVFVIEFLCPNGHRIRCQSEHVGRAARCPRCGVKFRVPDPADLEVLDSVGSNSGVLRPEFTDSALSSKDLRSIGAGEQKESQIEFLCPNGHRLHGPASLQNRPGQCPECGSRFRIPSYEDIPDDEETTHDIGIGRANRREGSHVGRKDAAEGQPTPPLTRSAEEAAMLTTILGRGLPGQAMAALVARLWELRPTGAAVELHLRDGETIVPDQFLRKLSQTSRQGVFTVKEADGSLSLTVVAWDAIARATIRGFNELPKGLAE